MKKKYIKNNIIKPLEGILVKVEFEKDGEIFYKFTRAKTESDVLLEGWILYEDIEDIKNDLLKEVIEYDKSENVNSFVINGVPAWIDRDTRSSLAYSTKCKLDSGEQTTALWLNGFRIEINCELLLGLLNQLEVYALACYDTTEQHKTNIINLSDLEEVKNYDYKTNYPEKLNITL